MRLFLKLALASLLALPAGAQESDGTYETLEDQPPPQQQQQQQYPPPDPNAYQQPAPTQQYGYVGPHPIPYNVGSGYCYEGGAHFHYYPPFDQYLFRESGGWFYFVGDPGDFGYASQMWGYRGHHPIPLAYGGGYCFIDWPHRHHYPPPYGAVYNNIGGYYVYGGPWDPWYWHYRPYYTRYYGGYYRSSYYGGVYWRVRPPAVYAPRVYVGAPGVYRAGAVAVAPGGARVYVGAPAPVRPGYRAVPAPAPVYRAPPPVQGGYRPAPGYHAAPAPYHPAPAPVPYHASPAPTPYHPAPAPAYRPAPAPTYHSAPAPSFHSAPAPARSFHR